MSTYQILRFVPAFVNDNLNYPSQFRATNVDETPQLVGAAGAITVYGWNFINPGASDMFVKFYNSTAAPTVGTTVPTVTLQVPTNGSIVLYGSEMIYYFSLGLWVAATLLIADNNAAAPVADGFGHINYKQ